MDAFVRVKIGTLVVGKQRLELQVCYDSSGDHCVSISVLGRDSFKLLGVLPFSPKQWTDFLQQCVAINTAVDQLRAKGLIFDFGDAPDRPKLPEPQKPGEGRILFLAEKMTQGGELVRQECRTLTECADFFKPDLLPAAATPQ